MASPRNLIGRLACTVPGVGCPLPPSLLSSLSLVVLFFIHRKMPNPNVTVITSHSDPR